MDTYKLKKLLKEHFCADDNPKKLGWDHFDKLCDTVDECIAGGGTVHIRYTLDGPELQFTYHQPPARIS